MYNQRSSGWYDGSTTMTSVEMSPPVDAALPKIMATANISGNLTERRHWLTRCQLL